MPSPRSAEHQERFKTANAQAAVTVQASDLPLHCPMPHTALWASHPRVFIPIDEAPDGQMRCPYCGTLFTLSTT